LTGWVTINSDASFHPTFKVGAFCFWIRHDDGKIVQSGGLKNCIGPLDAEIQSIGNGLYALLKSKFTPIDYIVVNTDCKYAIDAITGKRKHNSRPETVKAVTKIIAQLTKTHKHRLPKNKRRYPFIQYRYVPAHKSTETAKAWINDYCDKEAKRMLWNEINSKPKI
jgi:ribonuclease HI